MTVKRRENQREFEKKYMKKRKEGEIFIILNFKCIKKLKILLYGRLIRK